MAKEIKLVVTVEHGAHKGDQAFFFLRQPTPAELNAFKIQCASHVQHMAGDLATLCRAQFFDKLLQRVENLSGEDGKPITLARKSEIPRKWKADLIFFAFEEKQGANSLRKQLDEV